MLQHLAKLLWSWPTAVVFLGMGGMFLLRTRFLPLRKLPTAIKLIRPRKSQKGISAYGALCTALAATIGTGNIVGVATALAAGGPGALFWMLLAALLGMGTQYAEGYLGAKYRLQGREGSCGGPFAYIRKGLGSKFRWLSALFALVGASVGLLGVGTVTQVNSITSAAEGLFRSTARVSAFGREYSAIALFVGLGVTVAAAAVLLGGAKRITGVCEALVPIMSGIYLLCSLMILIGNLGQLPGALRLILHSAFSPKAALGATAGISLNAAIRMGIGRGVYTNEAGLGTAAIAAAASDEPSPHRQGLISMTGTFIDTIVICSLTGLCLVVTGAWSMPLEGVQITDHAWRTALPFAPRLSSWLLFVCLSCFGFATVIGWNFYAESCLRYLVGDRAWAQRLYRLAYLLVIAVSPLISVRSAWAMADILNIFMAAPNLLALFLLRKEIHR